MGPELVNIYIEKLLQTINELTKTMVLHSARVTYYEQLNATLNSKVEELQNSLDKALDKASSKTKKGDNDF